MNRSGRAAPGVVQTIPYTRRLFRYDHLLVSFKEAGAPVNARFADTQAADKLGLGWYDDATDYIGASSGFARAAPGVVQDSGKLLNSIDDLTTLGEDRPARRGSRRRLP